ncbi:Fic family protein [Laribacter hongkongensis]|uniref:Fic family protein n=1 Tax=Laribacter hongkongensis TaxID=168471 RepID=UPI001EFEB85E|nr:Fic family protein [Laribacter hongkongensis]MCG9060095.1 Fic family protein [Laribacter hongkongensis]MCG9084101.1 Fic family protein [Laribacter hongkongensis]MCG9087166.1 Fic family protein [Laribacter hongkongensis]
MKELIQYVSEHPAGVSAGQIMRHLDMSRATLNRRLKKEVEAGTIRVTGRGPATRYHGSDPLASLRSYFAKPHTERRIARYDPDLLEASPGLSDAALSRFDSLLEYRLDKRELGKFLIDFSCASSSLEGGTYSLLDTQALIEYGEKSFEKPLDDAFLVLNHKEAFEYLYDHMELTAIYKVHDLLTSDHELPELDDTAHFLKMADRGVVRECSEVDIRLSTYIPPCHPDSDYLKKALEHVLATADTIQNPVQAAFYLLSRISYLQPFKDGNKRTSRAICNVPLIKACLPPISFVDFGKKDYLVSMLAFYELGDTRLLEQCFIEAYFKSLARLRPHRHR